MDTYNGQPAHDLDALRQRRKLTQAKLARAVGVGQQHISTLERGRARPSDGLVRRLAAALGVTHRAVRLAVAASVARAVAAASVARASAAEGGRKGGAA